MNPIEPFFPFRPSVWRITCSVAFLLAMLTPALALLVWGVCAGASLLCLLLWVVLVWLPLPLVVVGTVGAFWLAVCPFTKKPRDAVIGGVGAAMAVAGLVFWLVALVIASKVFDLAIGSFRTGRSSAAVVCGWEFEYRLWFWPWLLALGLGALALSLLTIIGLLRWADERRRTFGRRWSLCSAGHAGTIIHHCPVCQQPLGELNPSVYGILYRRCGWNGCAALLPTTDWNGRLNLRRVCGICNEEHVGNQIGRRREYAVAVWGEVSTLKLAWLTRTVTELRRRTGQPTDIAKWETDRPCCEVVPTTRGCILLHIDPRPGLNDWVPPAEHSGYDMLLLVVPFPTDHRSLWAATKGLEGALSWLDSPALSESFTMAVCLVGPELDLKEAECSIDSWAQMASLADVDSESLSAKLDAMKQFDKNGPIELPSGGTRFLEARQWLQRRGKGATFFAIGMHRLSESHLNNPLPVLAWLMREAGVPSVRLRPFDRSVGKT